MTILHGDHLVQSRKELTSLIDEAKLRGQNIIRLEAKQLTEAVLEEALFGSDLFGTSQLIVVEGLHSLPVSKRKKSLIALLASAQDTSIILWEKRSLTKTMLKPFPQAKVSEFQTSKTLFQWLDSLGTAQSTTNKLSLLHEAIEADGDHFCYLMLARQIRLMIQVKDGGTPAGAPFMVSKIRKQASAFSIEKLLQLHGQLLEIDIAQKTSSQRLSMSQELDLVTTKV
jgi:hypothetical protein